MTAARRYKDITGGMSEAVAAMRRSDAERAADLMERLPELEEAMRTAHVRARLTEVAASVRWELAQEWLWGEQWMTLRPLPAPGPATPTRDLDYLDAVVEQRYHALDEALRRRSLLGRR